ncbi:MAG: polysaccharide pyruvyl transferase family protein, partial [Aliarcobacter skirrowii]
RPVLKKTNILENSVGIILNIQIFDRLKKEPFLNLYKEIIKNLLEKNKNVYILRHSYEDLFLCEMLKNEFKLNNNVFLLKDDFNCFELENIISCFDFVVASRYHSVIHAYKNNTPVLCIAWANKYYELLDYFNQLNYLFDCRGGVDISLILESLCYLNDNFMAEKNKIFSCYKKIKNDYKLEDIYKI